MIDYTMDIHRRLNSLNANSDMPEELAARKAKVLATLLELQNEVAPITHATEKLKDSEHMKDAKSFINILQKEYDVSCEYFALIFFCSIIKMFAFRVCAV